MSSVARFRESEENGRRVLHLQGDMTLPKLGVLPTRLDRLKGQGIDLDLSQVGRMDPIGAWLIFRTARDRGGEIRNAGKNHKPLLDQVAQYDQPVKVRPDPPPPLMRVLDEIGDATVLAGRTMVGLLGFFGALLIAIWKVATHPRRFRFNAVVQRFEAVGVRARALVGLVSLLVGSVIAQQG